MDRIDKLKIGTLHHIEQLRAEFDEFMGELDLNFKNAILDALEEEQARPELMVIFRMAKLVFFESLLANDPPGHEPPRTIEEGFPIPF